jgi:dolichyl-phosphate-mannose--protein O-mannosyl transferase
MNYFGKITETSWKQPMDILWAGSKKTIISYYFFCVDDLCWYWHFGIWFLTLDMCIIILQIVRPEPGTSAKQGDTIKSGTIIRLQHMRTRKWLHSHLHASPISGNLEVCFLFFLLQVFITIYALGFVGDCFL